ncbi:MAG TPA: ABC transporter permease [Gemmatimonadaceae bacterium]|nr:ABC transporter permease [Gemmatimonadaceae bacterium]
MKLGPGIRKLLRKPAAARAVEHDVDAELTFHLETRVDLLVSRGLSRAAAEAQARREFGDLREARAELAAIDRGRLGRERRADWREALLQDVRFAMRALSRRPSFLAVTSLTLALGIGANAAIFSVVDATLLKPLPYAEPDRLVSIWPAGAMMPGIFVYVRDGISSVSPVAGYSGGTAVSMTGASEPARLVQSEVTSRFFDVLGVRAAVGRTFLDGEDQPGRDRIAILGNALWQQRFGGDASVIGRSVLIDGVSRTIVGVMPPGFRFPSPNIDFWVPVSLDPSPANIARYWGGGQLNVVGRLRPGITRARAEQEAAALVDRSRASFPWRMPDEWGKGVTVVPLEQKVVGTVGPLLLVLFGSVGVVLLIACVNVANLLLSRAAAREREIAIRASLGAGRGRIVRQLLTESIILALIGGAIGLAVAAGGVRGLLLMLPPGMPRVTEVGIDARVLAFTMVTALVTGIAFGLTPALRASRPTLQGALGATRNAGGSLARRRLSESLVVAQIALGVVLVAGAGLLIKSFWRLHQVELGFRPEEVVAVDIPIPSFTSDTAVRALSFYNTIIDEVRGVPGVSSVAVASVLPFGGAGSIQSSFAAEIEAHPTPPGGSAPMLVRTVVSPDYFRAMSIPLVRGRALTASDREGSPPVALVDELTARRLWPNADAVGQRFRPVWMKPWVTVVGVVGTVKRDSLSSAGEIAVYLPTTHMAGFWFPTQMSLVVRSTVPLSALGPRIQRAIARVDRTVPVAAPRRVETLVADSAARTRFTVVLLATFAAVALSLGAVGIYGVVAYAVARRTREIGVRMALGARATDVLGMVLREGGVLAGAGVALGIVGALVASRVLASFLFGVTPNDPAVFVSVPLLLGLVALGACVIPARRASRVDPVVALRSD